MAAIWMLPSLVLGLYLGFSTGMWQLALMSFGSALIAVVVSRFRRPGAGESATTANPFTTVGQRIFYLDKPLTRWRWMLSPKLRASARSTASSWSSRRLQRAAGSARRAFGTRPVEGLPSARPNPSLKLTRYGRHCKPGLRYSVHCLSPGLQYLPPRAA